MSCGKFTSLFRYKFNQQVKRFIQLEVIIRGDWGEAAGELARRWNQIVPSLLNTFEKLRKLGFTYYNGKVSIISLLEKEDGHV